MIYVDDRNARRYMRIDNFLNRLYRSKCNKSNSYRNNFGSFIDETILGIIVFRKVVVYRNYCN